MKLDLSIRVGTMILCCTILVSTELDSVCADLEGTGQAHGLCAHNFSSQINFDLFIGGIRDSNTFHSIVTFSD